MNTAAGKSTRVLLVDDETALLILATRILSRMGCEVTAHSDPRKALNEFRSQPAKFDLIITDISMPGLSGSSLIAQVRTVRPDLPAVMTTGCITTADIDAAKRLGNTQLLPKSSSMDAYMNLLVPLLASKNTLR